MVIGFVTLVKRKMMGEFLEVNDVSVMNICIVIWVGRSEVSFKVSCFGL